MSALFQGFALQFLQGAALTVLLAALSLVLGVALGLTGAIARLWGGRISAAAATVYTTTIRGLPDLLVIFIAYFGGTALVSSLTGGALQVSPFVAGVSALGVITGAYMTEIFRGAINGVPRGQVEAARALGLSPVRVFVLVTLPQAWRLALPPIGNQTLILTKQTSLVSIVGLEDIMRKATIGAGFTQEPFTYYLVAALIYLLLTVALGAAFKAAERKAARGLART